MVPHLSLFLGETAGGVVCCSYSTLHFLLRISCISFFAEVSLLGGCESWFRYFSCNGCATLVVSLCSDQVCGAAPSHMGSLAVTHDRPEVTRYIILPTNKLNCSSYRLHACGIVHRCTVNSPGALVYKQ